MDTNGHVWTVTWKYTFTHTHTESVSLALTESLNNASHQFFCRI